MRRDLTTDTSYRDLVQRPLIQRSCQEVSYRDLANIAGIEILSRDLARRPGEENRDLAQRFSLESLNRDLIFRSLAEFFRGDLLQIALHYKGFLHSTFYREPVKEILRTMSYRDLHTGNIQNHSESFRIYLGIPSFRDHHENEHHTLEFSNAFHLSL